MAPLLPKGRIADEYVRRGFASVAVSDGNNRDIIEAVDGDALVVRDRSGQRPDFLAVIVDVIHASSLLSDLCAA